MKGLTSEYDSEKIELKNEENLKSKFSSVITGLNIEGAGAAFAAADVGYPTTIDGLRDRVATLASQRKKNLEPTTTSLPRCKTLVVAKLLLVLNVNITTLRPKII